MLLKNYIEEYNKGIDPKYYEKLSRIESSNNPNAKAKTSSAAGLFQFTEGTWKEMTKSMGVDYSLDDRYNPEKAREVVQEFTNRNRAYLTKTLQRNPNETELYLAHFLGSEGARKMLTSDANTSINDVVGKKQIAANKSIFLNKDGSAKKVGDIYNWAQEKLGTSPSKSTKTLTKKDTNLQGIAGTPTFVGTEGELAGLFADRDKPAPVVTGGEPEKIDFFNFAKIKELEDSRIEKEKSILQQMALQEQQEARQRQAQQQGEQQYEQPQSMDPYNYINIEEYQDGGEVKNKNIITISEDPETFRDIDITSKEYRDMYENDMVYRSDMDTLEPIIDMPEVVLTGKKREIPQYIEDIKSRSREDHSEEQQRVKSRSTIPTVEEVRYSGIEETEVMDFDEIMEKITPKDYTETVTEKNIDNISTTDYTNLEEGEKIKINRELVEKGIDIGIMQPKGREEVIVAQERLKTLGYDLGKYGAKGDGVDGINGRRTKAAIDDYNKAILTSDQTNKLQEYKYATERVQEKPIMQLDIDNDEGIKDYQSLLQSNGLMKNSISDYDTNFTVENLGKNRIEFKTQFKPTEGTKCKYGKACATFVTMETLHTLGSKTFDKSQVRGDAWTMNQKMLDSGGETYFSIFGGEKIPKLRNKAEINRYIESKMSKVREIDIDNLKDGDVVHIYNPNSEFVEQAYREMEGEFPTTHVGMIKTNSKGEKYVEHNTGTVHKESLENLISGQARLGSGRLQLVGVTRPKYNTSGGEYYETSSPYTLNFDKLTNPDSPLLKENLSLMHETLGRNLPKLADDTGVSEEQAKALLKAVVTVAWKESYGNENVDNPKLIDVRSLGQLDKWVRKTGAPVREAIVGTEASRGFTQMKDEKNLNEELRRNLLGDDEAKLLDPKSSAIATFYGLSSRLKYLEGVANKNNIKIGADELAKLSMVGWNEDISVVGASLAKYGGYEETIKEYRKDKETGSEVGHAYDEALNVYKNMFRLR